MKIRNIAFILTLCTTGLSSATAEEDYGLSAVVAYQHLQDKGEKILFVDVRDPVEIQFIGFTDLVDVNIPFLLVDREQWKKSKSRFVMERNDDFVDSVEEALQVKNLENDAMIITMCRSGSSRGEPSAALLRDAGFSNSYFIVNGFQGEVLTEGLLEGFRLKNGWQNSGLPWSSKMNGEKIWHP